MDYARTHATSRNGFFAPCTAHNGGSPRGFFTMVLHWRSHGGSSRWFPRGFFTLVPTAVLHGRSHAGSSRAFPQRFSTRFPRRFSTRFLRRFFTMVGEGAALVL